MLKIVLSGLVGVWAVTLVGVTLLAVRFYARERNRGRRMPSVRRASRLRAARAASAPAFRVEPEAGEVDAGGSVGLPSGPFVVLPGPRPKSEERTGARRRRSGRRHRLVR